MIINRKLIIFTLIIVAWLWIPTFTPDDLFTTVPIIGYFGMKVFLIVSIILIFLLWKFGVLKMLLKVI